MKYPAGLDSAVFFSNGSKLLGGFYRAAGNTRRPTAVLLHGVPGVEKNLDLAYALRDEGWNCLYFHYRGSWGSQGAFSFRGQVDDVRAATEWIVQQPSVDPDNLVLIGSSLGGYMTFAAGADDSQIRALIAMCPLVDSASAPVRVEESADYVQMLNGIGAEALANEWNSLMPVTKMAKQLRDRPILLVTAGKDELFPPDHYPLLLEQMPHIEWEHFPEADHVFSTMRAQLIHTVLSYLKKIVN